MSALSFYACHPLVAKVQNRFTNCFIRQIFVKASLKHRYVLQFRFRFQLAWLLQHGSPHVVLKGVQVWAVWWPGVLCQWSLGSACRAIPFVQLRNSYLKLVFPSIWCTSSKYSTKQHICAKLYARHISNIWCKKYSRISEIQRFSCWDILFCLTLYNRLRW